MIKVEEKKTHRGQIVESRIKMAGYSVTKLAEDLGIARNTLYTKFKEEKLSPDFIMQIGEKINYDFSLDFKELQSPKFFEAMEKELNFCKQEIEKLNNEYNQLMREHLEVMKENRQLLNEKISYIQKQDKEVFGNRSGHEKNK